MPKEGLKQLLGLEADYATLVETYGYAKAQTILKEALQDYAKKNNIRVHFYEDSFADLGDESFRNFYRDTPKLPANTLSEKPTIITVLEPQPDSIYDDGYHHAKAVSHVAYSVMKNMTGQEPLVVWLDYEVSQLENNPAALKLYQALNDLGPVNRSVDGPRLPDKDGQIYNPDILKNVYMDKALFGLNNAAGNSGFHGGAGGFTGPFPSNNPANFIGCTAKNIGQSVPYEGTGHYKIHGVTSNSGIDIAAPVADHSTFQFSGTDNSARVHLIGTSFAAPYYTGALAALHQRYGQYLSPAHIEAALFLTAEKPATVKFFEKRTNEDMPIIYRTNAQGHRFSEQTGFGIINPEHADKFLAHMVMQKTQQHGVVTQSEVITKTQKNEEASRYQRSDGSYAYEIDMGKRGTAIHLAFAFGIDNYTRHNIQIQNLNTGTTIPLMSSQFSTNGFMDTYGFMGEPIEKIRIISDKPFAKGEMMVELTALGGDDILQKYTATQIQSIKDKPYHAYQQRPIHHLTIPASVEINEHVKGFELHNSTITLPPYTTLQHDGQRMIVSADKQGNAVLTVMNSLRDRTYGTVTFEGISRAAMQAALDNGSVQLLDPEGKTLRFQNTTVSPQDKIKGTAEQFFIDAKDRNVKLTDFNIRTDALILEDDGRKHHFTGVLKGEHITLKDEHGLTVTIPVSRQDIKVLQQNTKIKSGKPFGIGH